MSSSKFNSSFGAIHKLLSHTWGEGVGDFLTIANIGGGGLAKMERSHISLFSL